MASWQPVMTPIKIIAIFLAVGVCFVPTGTSILKTAYSVSFYVFSYFRNETIAFKPYVLCSFNDCHNHFRRFSSNVLYTTAVIRTMFNVRYKKRIKPRYAT